MLAGRETQRAPLAQNAPRYAGEGRGREEESPIKSYGGRISRTIFTANDAFSFTENRDNRSIEKKNLSIVIDPLSLDDKTLSLPFPLLDISVERRRNFAREGSCRKI